MAGRPVRATSWGHRKPRVWLCGQADPRRPVGRQLSSGQCLSHLQVPVGKRGAWPRGNRRLSHTAPQPVTARCPGAGWGTPPPCMVVSLPGSVSSCRGGHRTQRGQMLVLGHTGSQSSWPSPDDAVPGPLLQEALPDCLMLHLCLLQHLPACGLIPLGRFPPAGHTHAVGTQQALEGGTGDLGSCPKAEGDAKEQ